MKNKDGRILFVLTNHDTLGPGGESGADKTGFHLAEASHPWQILTQAGFGVDFASPRGGKAPIDPGSHDLDDDTNRAFMGDELVRAGIENTARLSSIDLASYDGIYFPGGHGTMWDLPDNDSVKSAVRKMFEDGKIVAAVCHGPAALVNVKLSNGDWLVDGKTVSVFTDAEEKAVEKDSIVPFLLAKTLEERGANHVKADNFDASVSVDGNLITGQNPASASGVGKAICDELNKKKRKAA